MYRPVWQSLHDGAPLPLNWPGPQDAHASMDVLRGLGLNLPAAQLVHDDDTALLHVPAAQSVQEGDPARLHLPAAQGASVALEEPGEQ